MTVEEKIGILVERYCRNRSHLADMIGVSPQTVNNWVYRDRIPEKGIKAIINRSATNVASIFFRCSFFFMLYGIFM